MEDKSGETQNLPLPVGAVISSAEKKHRWSKALKKFCDGESYCLDCGLLRERHGLLGT